MPKPSPQSLSLRFGFRFLEFRHRLKAARTSPLTPFRQSPLKEELVLPLTLPSHGWTLIDDRVVPGIYKDVAGQEYSQYFTVLPKGPKLRWARDMLGFTLGLPGKNPGIMAGGKEVMIESSLWVIDKWGRVQHSNDQFHWSGRGLHVGQYASIRHPLPHDIKPSSWVVVAVTGRAGDSAPEELDQGATGMLSLAGEELLSSDYQDAEDPMVCARLVSGEGGHDKRWAEQARYYSHLHL